MFIPNTFGLLARRTTRNIHSEWSYGVAKRVPCAIVHLTKGAEKTTVRADSSASRGNAEESVAAAKILFPTSVNIQVNDRFEIKGVYLRVVKIEPRNDVLGRHDHNEIDLEILK